ncbi:alanine--glyoxylate aminotransferase family protein [Oceanicoccus sp. KOV_DT_Chl]|uniref:pyridoxal-phosphate-dependent aminotransferase family protein n=1 Tax=Oceanicoccus sp. KOV_DT_Chl TaxID=1904639 RepID=UPI000C7A8064|nr:aminotransferase class V-fold PLP-dependent enzyme [Oceanicoccus sp. KOV_DT_Chl]
MNIAVPHVEQLNRILPEEPLLMMGAGPVPIPAAVAAANGIVINHLGETMAKVVDQVKRMGRYIFQTETEWLLGVAGPGSAAMEMAVANLVWPGTRVLSVCNGFFSDRLAEMAVRAGGEMEKLVVVDGEAADPEVIAAYLKTFKPQVLTMVQGETSNTTFNRALPEIAAIAAEHDCLLVVDAVCTLSTMPLEMDNWGIDAVITGGQKGLSSIPGVSLVAFSDKAWQRVINRTEPMRHWTLDATLATNFWHRASYHYTAPVSGLLALHEAMRLVCDETLEKRFARHAVCSIALQAAIEAVGLELYVKPRTRLNSVVGIKLPVNIDGKAVCAHISKNYKVEISGSFGPAIVRIGQMGEQCRAHNLFRTLHAFGSTFKDLGVSVDVPAGMAMLESKLQQR